MPLGREARAKLEDTQAQVSRLRAQVEALVKEIGPSVSHVANRTGSALSEATGITREQAKAALGEVTLAQVGLVVVAAAVGWAIGRFSR
ncbi:MAG TPA: hypothetical protein VHB27_01510 [Rhodopila sp.]|uniref:hypothetical protein n=1 Tax=Rhodopila sp. TaxID=2480087 RepID=UPI002C728934|nr:hypothetical protein [Rhodopila sp.]HVY13875.1 hypothetical protein [Rhodopila sp.]